MEIQDLFLPPFTGEVALAKRETKGAAPNPPRMRHPLSQSAHAS
jgi:hypothetical protein